MLKSCQYCGRIHEKNYDCGKKPKRIKRKGDIEKYRSSKQWQNKAEEIKERDNYLCQFCIREMQGTVRRLNSENLSVHHAIPMREDFDKREDNDNLLTTCDVHHEMAESGEIGRDIVLKIIQEQEGIPR